MEFWFKEIETATRFKCRILIKYSSEDNIFWIYQNIYDATSVVRDWCCSSCLLLTKNITRRIDEIIQIFIETNSYPWTWTLNSHKNTTQKHFLAIFMIYYNWIKRFVTVLLIWRANTTSLANRCVFIYLCITIIWRCQTMFNNTQHNNKSILN